MEKHRNYSTNSYGSTSSQERNSASFGQKAPTLLECLKDILKRYPEGGQILKELIQNAEDAEARTVKFLFDENSYPTDTLYDPGMAAYQGPALYAYNDAVFRPEDWSSIQSVQRSSKATSPIKVGRFGIGFNSVYHITDLPSIVSGEFFGILDPHEQFFGLRETGCLWPLDSPDLLEIPDQLRPYQNVFAKRSDLSDGYYDGTLFRFPLRSRPSELGSEICGKETVEYLFESFIVDADIVLLFLKNLEFIEIFKREKGNENATLVHQIKVADANLKTVRRERTQIVRSILDKSTAALSKFHRIELESFDRQDGTITKREWLVNHYKPARDGISRDLADLSLQLCNIPWVSVALPLDEFTEQTGRVFCFLPLSPPSTDETPTGLPVNVNAYFGMTDNRRDIKWLDAEQRRDLSALWNDGLLCEVIPYCYGQLLIAAVDYTSDVIKLEKYLPDLRTVDPKWLAVAETMYQFVFEHKIIFCEINGGAWMAVNDAILDCEYQYDETVISCIRTLLLDNGYPIVRLAEHVQKAAQALYAKYDAVQKLTPAFVRLFITKVGQTVTKWPRNEILAVLDYILNDEQYAGLDGLWLLPLQNGDIVQFSVDAEKRRIYVVKESQQEAILSYVKDFLLDTSLEASLVEKLVASEGNGAES